jgi:methyl coenzyme M reductase beta subunit
MPNDMLLCDVQNAAAAQPQYRVATGSYYDGPCEGLPGFTGTPGVTCTATGNASGFSIYTHSPDATYVGGCTWQSGDPPTLICS